MSSIKLSQVVNILPEQSDRVVLPMRRRLPVREIISRRMKQKGLNPPAIARRASEKGVALNPSTIKQILNGSTVAPSVFTCEAIALGMDLPPMQFIAELLGDRTEEVKGSQFANLADVYKELTPTQKQKADVFIDGLLLQLLNIKNQPK